MVSNEADIDIAVIGAGVVGLAIAAALAAGGREVIILEAANAIGTGTSSRNSEVIHAGIYYPAGSLKADLCREGRRMLYAWCDSHGVAYAKTGKLIVATDAREAEALAGVQAKAAANGVALALISAEAARQLEPDLACVAALLSPETGIIDSHGYMLSLLGTAEDHGAALALSTPVLGGDAADGGIALHCGGAEPMTLVARTVINAAGLGAQALSQRLGAKNVPPLFLAKGSYFSLSHGRSPFRHLIYPVPVEGGLGVHYTVDLAGQGRFGPDVEWLAADTATLDARTYEVDAARGDAFYAAVRRYWPGLPDGALAPSYSGIRPKVSGPGMAAADFLIHPPETTGIEGLFTLYGIESPGLTASLALAGAVLKHVSERE